MLSQSVLISETQTSKFCLEVKFSMNTGNTATYSIDLVGNNHNKDFINNFDLRYYYDALITSGIYVEIMHSSVPQPLVFSYTKEDILANTSNFEWKYGEYEYTFSVRLYKKVEVSPLEDLIYCYPSVFTLNVEYSGSKEGLFAGNLTLGIDAVGPPKYSKEFSINNNGALEVPLYIFPYMYSHLLSEELKIKITQPYFSMGNNLTLSQRGIFVLPETSITVLPDPPKCNGESGTFEIGNLPHRSSDAVLRVNVIELKDGSSGDTQAGSTQGPYSHENASGPLYWFDQETIDISIPIIGSSYTIHDGLLEGLELKEGFYLIQASFFV